MALFAGLMAAQAGQSAGQVDAARDIEQQRQFNAQQAEQQREFDAQQRLQAAQLGVDPVTGKRVGPTIPKNLSQVLPGNKGKGTPNDQDYARHYLALAAANAGTPYADAFMNIAQQYGYLPERQATADYKNAQVWKIRVADPKEFQQKLGMERDKYIAQINASMDRLAMQIGARQDLAQYNAQQRMQLAGMTAYYRMQTNNDQDAFRAALDEYNQNMQNYRSDISASGRVTSPFFGQVPSMPTPFQMPTQPFAPYWPTGGGSNVTINLGPNGPQVVKGNGAGGGGKTPSITQGGAHLSPQEKAVADTLVSGLHGRHDAGQQLGAALAQGAITQNEAMEAARRLGVNITTPAPRWPIVTPQQQLNDALGGSNAGANPTLP